MIFIPTRERSPAGVINTQHTPPLANFPRLLDDRETGRKKKPRKKCPERCIGETISTTTAPLFLVTVVYLLDDVHERLEPHPLVEVVAVLNLLFQPRHKPGRRHMEGGVGGGGEGGGASTYLILGLVI